MRGGLSTFRAAAAPVYVAAARLRRGGAAPLVMAAGIALAAATVGVVFATTLVIRDRQLAQALRDLSPRERSVVASWGGLAADPGDAWPRLDRSARRALAPVGEVGAAMLFREGRSGGALVSVGAIADLPHWVRLRSGRLPRPCRTPPCEVLQVGGARRAPSFPQVVRVGTATLRPGSPVGPLVGGSRTRTFLLADGVSGLWNASDWRLIYRTYGWSLPLVPGRVHVWELDELETRIVRARSNLGQGSALFDVSAPLEELRAVRRSSDVGARRLLLVGGEGAALLLVFAVLAAVTLRRGAERSAERLAGFGARRWQVGLAILAETGAVAVAGTAVGWAAAGAIGAVIAESGGSPGATILLRTLFAPGGVLLGLAVAVAAWAVVVLTATLRPLRVGGRSVTPLDGAALAAVAVAALALARGRADAEALAEQEGAGAVLLLLPGLVACAAGIVFARLLAPALRILDRAAPRARPELRIALLSLTRAGGWTSVAAVFVVVSLAFALFAAQYRTTLDRNIADQAAFAVPLDYTLRENLERLVTVQRAASLERYRELGAPVSVVRTAGAIPHLPGEAGFTVLGVPADALGRLPRWRRDFAERPVRELARLLTPARGPGPRGPRIPFDAEELRLPVDVKKSLAVAASIRTTRGDVAAVALGETDRRGDQVLRGRIPPHARGGRLIGLTLATPEVEGYSAGHHDTGAQGGTGEVATRGVLELGTPLVRTERRRRRLAVDYRNWIGVNRVRARAEATRASIRFVIDRQLVSAYRPRQPTDGRPIPALASPRLAAAAGRGGILPVQVVGEPVRMKIVGTVRRFPTVSDDVLVADARWLETALNAQAPGIGTPSEIWLRAPAGAADKLRAPPFDRLDVTSRRALERRLRDDPLARGTLLVLGLSAVAALVLGLLGLLLAVASERRDRAGELFDLEADGATPRQLRRHVRVRALAVTLAGALAGGATGAAIGILVVDFVALTAGGEQPVPPLAASFSWSVLAGVVGAYAAAATAVVALATWNLFRTPAVARVVE